MISISNAFQEDFENIYFLLRKLDPRINKAKWYNIFSHPWSERDSQYGFVLKENDIIKGFIGTIKSNRIINNNQVSYCNITSWIVLDEIRRYSIDLIIKCLEIHDHISVFSANQETDLIYRKLGFSCIDNKRYVIDLKKTIPKQQNNRLKISFESKKFKQKLNKNDYRIHINHLQFARFCYLFAENRECFLVFRITLNKFNERCAHIHYVSCSNFFCRYVYDFSVHFKNILKINFLYIDCRLLGKVPQNFKIIKLPSSRYYKSPDDAIVTDNLYSEFFLLDI